MSRTIVFLGPTIDAADARCVLDGDFRPPVQRGDVLRALYREPEVIGIIDGYFHSVRSVWHKEILVALERGVRVYGAASICALRAAELHRFGMIGVGEVFKAYRDGLLEDDDEVAVVHAPAEHAYRPLSVAMVDMRDAYAAAAHAGVVPVDVVDQLLTIAKALHYGERSHHGVLAAARGLGTPAAKLDALRRFLHGYGPTLKERDALAMLQAIANPPEAGVFRVSACPPVQRTTYLRGLEAEVFAQEFPWGRVTGFKRPSASRQPAAAGRGRLDGRALDEDVHQAEAPSSLS
jgi:hypothetical protein